MDLVEAAPSAARARGRGSLGAPPRCDSSLRVLRHMGSPSTSRENGSTSGSPRGQAALAVYARAGHRMQCTLPSSPSATLGAHVGGRSAVKLISNGMPAPRIQCASGSPSMCVMPYMMNFLAVKILDCAQTWRLGRPAARMFEAKRIQKYPRRLQRGGPACLFSLCRSCVGFWGIERSVT